MSDRLKDVAKTIAAATTTSVDGYDTTATVVRVEDGTAYIHIEGGADETPATMSIACTSGDKVRVRIANGKAWVTGNDSAPPTDDTQANKAKATADTADAKATTAKKSADAANTTATKAYAVVEEQQNYFWHDDEGSHVKGMTDGYQTTVDAHGLSVDTPDGTEMAFFGVNYAGNSMAVIGSTGEAHQEMDYHSWKMVDRNGEAFAEVRDLTEKDGRTYVTESFHGDGVNQKFPLKYKTVKNVEYFTVKVNGIERSDWDFFESEELYPNGVVVMYGAPSGEIRIRHAITESISYKTYCLGTSVSQVPGRSSVAEGYDVDASGDYSHAEGENSVASGHGSHAENTSVAEGDYSHAEGGSTASGYCAHAEGSSTTASGNYSHAEGSYTTASGNYSHAAGLEVTAGYEFQTVIGTYNSNIEEDAFEIGNGTSDAARSNAFRVTKAGDTYAAGDIYSGDTNLTTTQTSQAESIQSLTTTQAAQAESIQSLTTTQTSQAESIQSLMTKVDPIGMVYSATKTVGVSGTNINTYTTGATITVPGGTYVIAGQWTFEYATTSGSRNIDVDIMVGSKILARSRVVSSANNYAVLNASTIETFTDEKTSIVIRGSSSKKTSADTQCWIKAVKLC